MIIRRLLVSALTILIMGMGANQALAAPLIEMPAQIIAGESSIDDVVVDAFEAAASGVKLCYLTLTIRYIEYIVRKGL